MTTRARLAAGPIKTVVKDHAAMAVGVGALVIALVALGACSSNADETARAAGEVRIWARGTPANDHVFSEAGGAAGAPVDEARWAELNNRIDGGAPMFWEYMERFGDLPKWTIADYVDVMALYTDDRSDGSLGLDTHPDIALRSDDGDLLYIPWGRYSSPDENGHPYAQAVADFSDPAWLEILASAIRQGPDHLGIFLDDVNHHQWIVTAEGMDTWPAGWTADSWSRRLADFLETVRGEFPDRTIVHNTQPFVTDYRNGHVQRGVVAADLQFWEYGWTSTAVEGAATMRAQIADARRIHALGRGIVHMASDPDPVEVERNLVGYLLTNAGSDFVGDSGAAWWGGDELWDWYALDLGEARNEAYEPTPGLFVRDFERGTAVMNWSGTATTWGETTIPHGRAHVDTRSQAAATAGRARRTATSSSRAARTMKN